MKAMKSFVRTCYSETLLASGDGEGEGDEKKAAESSFVIEEGMGGGGEGAPKEEKKEEQMFLGGLGLKFKFPGDPKKYVHLRSVLVHV